jgi:hypothetical protein
MLPFEIRRGCQIISGMTRNREPFFIYELMGVRQRYSFSGRMGVGEPFSFVDVLECTEKSGKMDV